MALKAKRENGAEFNVWKIINNKKDKNCADFYCKIFQNSTKI